MFRLSSYWGILSLAIIQSFIQHPLIATAQEVPKGECKAAFGEILCGYNCVAAYGTIKCATWPGGVCMAAYGEIVCGPAPPPNWILLYGKQGEHHNKGRDNCNISPNSLTPSP